MMEGEIQKFMTREDAIKIIRDNSDMPINEIKRKQLKKQKERKDKMDYKDLANLIFPEAKDIQYYEEKYP